MVTVVVRSLEADLATLGAIEGLYDHGLVGTLKRGYRGEGFTATPQLPLHGGGGW